MISTDRSNIININQDTYGTLGLIKNQILGKFKRLMDANEAKTVYQTGYFRGEPMPYAYTFAPFGRRNQAIIRSVTQGQKLEFALNGNIVGHMVVSSVYKLENPHNSIFAAREVELDDDNKTGKYAVSGEFEIYDNTLAKIKKSVLNTIKEKNYQKVTALMLTADPFHRLHERLVRMTIDKADITIIFLIRTLDSKRNIDFKLRQKTLEYFVSNFLPSERVIIVPFENSYLFSNHINPVLECLTAYNFGATKLVVGQNHGGIGMFYDHNQPSTILDNVAKNLDIELIVMPELVYCNQCRTIVSTKTCPHGQHHHIKYKSDTLKELLFRGILPPAILMRKEISAMILSTLFPDRFENFQKICDDLFPNVGLLEERTQSDFYLELMSLYQTTSLT
ncbi:MAG: sulfate adenylyltransferase [Campylobacter sp.]|nr:sulfate adenylyltransferase [Campylobacter sp.]